MKNVLIVDDDLDVVGLIDWNLNKWGYRTSAALNGIEAMKRIEEYKPDLVLLDLMMPEMDGWALCRWIKRNEDDDVRKTPVIIISARKDPLDKVVGLNMGADDYISKPFDIMELGLRIKKLINRSVCNQNINFLS